MPSPFRKAIGLLVVLISLATTTLAQSAIYHAAPDLSANAFERISYRFDDATNTISTQLGDMTTPPTFGTLQGILSLGDDFYYFGIGYGAGPGYSTTTAPVAFGSTINADSTWVTQSQLYSPVTGAYFGLRIDQGGGDFTYGWAHVDYGQAGAGSTRLISLAFAGPINESITAGATAIPEPAAASLLLAVAGLAWATTRRPTRQPLAQG